MTKANIAPTSSFWTLFKELRTTRTSYEALLAAGMPLNNRANHLERLHTIRAEMAVARQGIGL